MNIFEVIILTVDLILISASIVCLTVYLVIAFIKKIRKQDGAGKTVVKGFIAFFLCLIGSVVATWILKLGFKFKEWIRSDTNHEKLETENNTDTILPDLESDIIFEETD